MGLGQGKASKRVSGESIVHFPKRQIKDLTGIESTKCVRKLWKRNKNRIPLCRLPPNTKHLSVKWICWHRSCHTNDIRIHNVWNTSEMNFYHLSNGDHRTTTKHATKSLNAMPKNVPSCDMVAASLLRRSFHDLLFNIFIWALLQRQPAVGCVFKFKFISTNKFYDSKFVDLFPCIVTSRSICLFWHHCGGAALTLTLYFYGIFSIFWFRFFFSVRRCCE